MSSIEVFVGPMSQNIVDATIEFHQENPTVKMGFIPSRRQVECEVLGGGYVNNWTTEKFIDYVRGKSEDILVVRDHGGPLQGELPDDGVMSLLTDITSGFNIIHIDPWKQVAGINDAAKVTASLIHRCMAADSSSEFEVGTEQAIRAYGDTGLDRFLEKLSTILGEKFSNVKYAVVQSGTTVDGLTNTGEFNSARSSAMVGVCDNFGLIPKEHNADYLSSSDVKARWDAGVVAFNLAPEFGVLETTCILDAMEEHGLHGLRDEFIEICVKSRKWKKWVQNLPAMPDEKTLAIICGHYVFSRPEFLKIKTAVSEACEIDKIVRETIKKRLWELTSANK